MAVAVLERDPLAERGRDQRPQAPRPLRPLARISRPPWLKARRDGRAAEPDSPRPLRSPRRRALPLILRSPRQRAFRRMREWGSQPAVLSRNRPPLVLSPQHRLRVIPFPLFVIAKFLLFRKQMLLKIRARRRSGGRQVRERPEASFVFAPALDGEPMNWLTDLPPSRGFDPSRIAFGSEATLVPWQTEMRKQASCVESGVRRQLFVVDLKVAVRRKDLAPVVHEPVVRPVVTDERTPTGRKFCVFREESLVNGQRRGPWAPPAMDQRRARQRDMDQARIAEIERVFVDGPGASPACPRRSRRQFSAAWRQNASSTAIPASFMSSPCRVQNWVSPAPKTRGARKGSVRSALSRSVAFRKRKPAWRLDVQRASGSR